MVLRYHQPHGCTQVLVLEVVCRVVDAATLCKAPPHTSGGGALPLARSSLTFLSDSVLLPVLRVYSSSSAPSSATLSGENV